MSGQEFPNLKDFIFIKDSNSVAERVKNFLPKIDKANKELEGADEETKKEMMLEYSLQQIDSEKEDSEAEDNEEDDSESSEDSDADQEAEDKKEIEVTFTCFKEKSKSDKESEEDDFIIRPATSEDEPESKKAKTDEE